MNTILVPPDCKPDEEQVSAVADYLISGLLHVSPACLHATFDDSASKVIWYLDTIRGSVSFHEMKKNIFRTILARIGSYYMSGQVYGGTSRIILIQNAKEFPTNFEMGNSGHHGGFWIKITTEG